MECATTAENSPVSASASSSSRHDVEGDPKVFVTGFPKFYPVKKWRALLTSLSLPFVKAKKVHGLIHGYVSFKDKESCEKAIQVLHGQKIKKNTLVAKMSEPKGIKRDREEEDGAEGEEAEGKGKQKERADSSVHEEGAEKAKRGGGRGDARKKRKTDGDEAQQEAAIPDHINDVVTPLWKLAYEEQLKQKRQEMIKTLKQITQRVRKESKYNVPEWVKQRGGRPACDLVDLKEAPVREGYRNKVSFTIGVDLKGKICVGFSLGKTEQNITCVADPAECANVPSDAKLTRNIIQQFIESTNLPAFNKIDHAGFWRQLEIRTCQSGEVMAVLQVRTADVEKEEVAKVKQQFTEHFAAHKTDTLHLASLYFQEYDGISNRAPHDLPVEHLWGEKYIYETVCGLKFRISPASFFQVNTKGAEVLYTIIAEWCEADAETTVFDICCGTGTIGLTMARHVKDVVGIEMVESAVKDCELNAEINGITNARFVLGKAEDVLPSVLEQNVEKCVGIVDPPRGGLHPAVLRAIRKASFLKRLVYVSCSQRSLLENVGILCRAPSKTLSGEPFKPVRAIAVDMFPHTTHCELVVLFERS
ncbi:tRNA methyltransferase 2 [Balamuthia mandrillaris]